ncbi:uncharacterized protein LOC141691795 [Apium graveolens]|uniref:uncharacterized protein LOC141691795 n=1 Tax=Apium graveolens TaxID=4045 RepID=UPI003D7BA4B8
MRTTLIGRRRLGVPTTAHLSREEIGDKDKSLTLVHDFSSGVKKGKYKEILGKEIKGTILNLGARVQNINYGPGIEEEVGLDVEDRKRIRSGSVSKSTMDTDDLLMRVNNRDTLLLEADFSDKEGIHPHSQMLMDGFRMAIEDCNLVELDLTGGKHTVSSDHEPIELNLVDTLVSRKQFRFRFENSWLKEPSFKAEVKGFWKALLATHILPKLIFVSFFMSKWGRNFFHKFKDKVKCQKEVLNVLKDHEDEEGIKTYFEEKEKLNELLEHEESYWKQRAKIFWLKEGDTNSRFFHEQASKIKKCNKITYSVNEDEVRVDSHDQMCRLVKEYFESVFTEMHPNKASGPDGYRPAFFHYFWSLVGREVFRCCKKGSQDGEVALKLDISKDYDWVHYMVCLNGSYVGPIIPSRGLRQGDPLFPYLFLLCVEGLSNLLNNIAANENIHGCRISRFAPAVTHLLFADDSFMFFKAVVEETKIVKDLLNLYEKQSGQAVKFQKSAVFFSSNVRRDKQNKITSILGEIEKMFNGFWWKSGKNSGKGIRWNLWEKMCMTKNRGGLGFRCLYSYNMALLGKHIWNFLNNPESLVARIFKARYFPDKHIFKAQKGSNASFIWSVISEYMEEFYRGFKWVLDDGRSINIFTDQWLRGKADYWVDIC